MDEHKKKRRRKTEAEEAEQYVVEEVELPGHAQGKQAVQCTWAVQWGQWDRTWWRRWSCKVIGWYTFHMGCTASEAARGPRTAVRR